MPDVRFRVALLSALVALFGAGGGPAASADASSPAEAEERLAASAETGRIVGVVRVVPPIPPEKPPRVIAAALCGNLRTGDPVPDYRLTLDESDGALADVIVHFEEPPDGWQPAPASATTGPEANADGDGEPLEPAVTIRQVDCRFEPRVVSLTAGESIRFVQADELNHMLVYGGKVNEVGRFRHHVDERPIDVRISDPEMVVLLRSGFYWWMTGHVGVFEHPWHDVSDAEGAFEIVDVPAGKHVLRTWHELETIEPVRPRVPVEVRPGEETRIVLEYRFTSGDRYRPNASWPEQEEESLEAGGEAAER